MKKVQTVKELKEILSKLDENTNLDSIGIKIENFKSDVNNTDDNYWTNFIESPQWWDSVFGN